MSLKRIEAALIILNLAVFFIDIRLAVLLGVILTLLYIKTSPGKALIPITVMTFMELGTGISPGGIPLTVAKIGLGLLLLLYIRENLPLRNTAFLLPILTFGALFLFHLAFTHDRETARWTLTIWGNVLYFFVTFNLCAGKKENFSFLVKGIFMALIFNSLMALYQGISGGHTIHGFGLNNDLHRFERFLNFIRPSGFFQNTNLLTVFLLPASLFIFPLTEKKFRPLFIFPAAAFLITFSRSAWIALIFSVIVIAISMRKKGIALIALLAAVFLFSPFSKRFFESDPQRSVEYSDLGRKYAYSAALSEIKSDPVIGTGPGRLKMVFSKYAPYHLPMKELFTHSTYLSVQGETGILGFAALLSMMLLSLHSLWRKFAGREYHVAGLFSIFIFMLFFDLQWEPQFWLIILLSALAGPDGKENDILYSDPVLQQ